LYGAWCCCLRLLRDASLTDQLVFAKNIFVQGPKYGDAMERRRLLRRLRAANKVPVAVKRLQALTQRTTEDRAIFAQELAHARAALAMYNSTRRRPPPPDPSFFLDVYPVFVRDPTSGDWVRGIFNGFDDDNRPLVAVGEGANLTLRSYKAVRMDFEDERPVVITNDLLAWQQQEHDHLNAMSGAPLGEFGRISLEATAASQGDIEKGTAASEAAFASLSMPRTALFVFHLNLTEPMGFGVRERLGKVYVRDVNPAGQGATAGMSNMCAICRIGGKTVRNREEFQLAIVKRRIVSAQLRRKELIAAEEGDDDAMPTIPLSLEDRTLLANMDVASLISPIELSELTAEIQDVEGGMLAHCSVTFMDYTFTTHRHVPYDFDAFHQIATYKPEEPYWEKYGFIISRFKSSSRHFEQWANIRKVAAVLVQVSLAPYKTTVQATTMIGICTAALLLQVRLQPYDDMNIMNEMNSADAVISNNNLETSLLILQITQLCWGLLTLFIDLPETLTATVYIFIILLGAGLSLVALSTEFAKTVYAALHAIAPFVSAVQGLLGFGDDEVHAQTSDAKKRHLDRMSAMSFRQKRISGDSREETKDLSKRLLEIATTYEKTAKQTQVSTAGMTTLTIPVTRAQHELH